MLIYKNSEMKTWLVFLVLYSFIYFIFCITIGLYYEEAESVFAYLNKYLARLNISPPYLTNNDFLMFRFLKFLNYHFSSIDWFAFNRLLRNIIGFATINYVVSFNSKLLIKILITLVLILFFFDSIFLIENVRSAGILTISIICVVLKGNDLFPKMTYRVILSTLVFMALTTRIEVPFIYVTLFLIINYVLNKTFHQQLLKLNIIFLSAAFFFHGMNAFTNVERPKKGFIHEKLIDDTSYFDLYMAIHDLADKESILYKAKRFFIYDTDVTNITLESILEKYPLTSYFRDNPDFLLKKYISSVSRFYCYNPYLIVACVFVVLVLFRHKKFSLKNIIFLNLAFFAFLFLLGLITYTSPRVFTPAYLMFFIIMLDKVTYFKQAHGYLILLIFLGGLNVRHFNATELKKQHDINIITQEFYLLYQKYAQKGEEIYLANMYLEGIFPNKLFEKSSPSVKFINYGGLDEDETFKIEYFKTYGYGYEDIENRFKYVAQNNGLILLDDELKSFYEKYMKSIKKVNINFEEVECLSLKKSCLYQLTFDHSFN